MENKNVLRDFNLLVTTTRGNEEDACSEIWYLLGEIGDSAATVDKTGITGLIAARTAFNPFGVIEKFRELLKQRPWEFRYTFRVIPIEKVVRTRLEDIERVVAELASKIDKDESFRVTVEKRFTQISTKDVIEAAAAYIERRVDLESPDKIVLVEIVGKLTGISIVKPSDLFSVMKEKFR
ncbi:MAG: THUMP domain-containing protein [Candidatus Bathyarchaeota archaeon]|nr:THUMP domain-containing protein [Candidatus Bathyarchaeota archaeon]MDH5732485.1 THUMP domain-containing protein [Candidatus Bathyarchaeota archaeon]